MRTTSTLKLALVISTIFSVTALAVDSPPLIVNPPVSVTVAPGLPASFSVGATGTALTYQWQVSRNGGVTFTNISATATNASYVTAPTTLADNSNRYQVVVSGACSPPATSSPAAILTVDPAAGLPVITTHPQSCHTQPGVAVSFTAYSPNATGYQWRFNGVDIPGATGSTLLIANPQPTNSGYYLAIATNANGWVPSQKAYLAVVSDQGVVPFSNIGFAQILSAYNYPAQLLNGVATLVAGPELDQMQPVPVDPWWPPLPTSEPITTDITDGYYDYGDVVSVPTVSPGQTVYYRVDVTDTIFSSTRPSRVLTLAAGGGAYPTPSVGAIQFPCYIEWPDPIHISASATNQVHNPSETVTLTASYWCCNDFGYPPNFQWRKDGVLIPGATNFTGGIVIGAEGLSPFLTLTNVQPADAGNYDLVVKGSYAFVDVNTSLSIRFTNSAIPVLITSQPAEMTVCAGSPASFTVTTAGTNLGYQWQLSQDGGATFANVSATATNTAYTNLNATLADNGKRYQVIVIGSGLSQTSSPALLTVNTPATASAGANQTISAYSSTLPLGGSVGGCAAGGVWTTAGTGAFSPSATVLNACYAPSAADLAVGTVTLTLTSIGPCAPCLAATAQVVVTIQWPPVSFGTTTLLEGPSAGVDSVVLAASAPTNTWTATANDAWLHLDTANQSGTGSTNVIFSYDANPDATRIGTLTIGGQTLTVTQAGSSYVAAPAAAATAVASGLGAAWYVDVDGAGSVYIAYANNNTIKRWTPLYNTVSTVVTLATNNFPVGVAVNGAGNIYMSDVGDNTLKVWSAVNHTLSTLVPSGLNTPYGIVVDWVGNVYIADTGNNTIKAWKVANNTVTTLATAAVSPYGVAVDRAGNVYFPDGNSIKQWTAANNNVTTLASRTGYHFYGVAVDGAGNVFYSTSDGPLKRIGKWGAANNTFTTLVSFTAPVARGVAVDGAGNVYFADPGWDTIKELPHAFVDPTAKTEGPAAGSDVLLMVLPATANLLAPFAPTSDQAWLTITGITNGVVSFAFEANTGSSNRTAHITLLGQAIAITQTALTSPTLIGPTVLSNGTIQFAFSNSDPGVSFTVLTATNPSLPLSNWTVAGSATNAAPGVFQFSTDTTNYPQGFYRVRSP